MQLAGNLKGVVGITGAKITQFKAHNSLITNRPFPYNEIFFSDFMLFLNIVGGLLDSFLLHFLC